MRGEMDGARHIKTAAFEQEETRLSTQISELEQVPPAQRRIAFPLRSGGSLWLARMVCAVEVSHHPHPCVNLRAEPE